MHRLKSPIVHPNAATHCSAGFYASAARLPPSPLLFSITRPYTPLLVIPHATSPRLLPTIPQTHPSRKTTLSRPPRLLPNSLRPRSHPLFPLFAHREMARRISPTNCHSTFLHPSRLLPDARSPALAASGQFPIFGPIVLRQNVQTQNHISFPRHNRKNSLA